MSRSNLEILLLFQPQDYDYIRKSISDFKSYSKEELVNAYNSEDKIGIVAKGQAARLVALNDAFLREFKKSPILIDRGMIMSLSGQIEFKQDNWEYRTDNLKAVRSLTIV